VLKYVVRYAVAGIVVSPAATVLLNYLFAIGTRPDGVSVGAAVRAVTEYVVASCRSGGGSFLGDLCVMAPACALVGVVAGIIHAIVRRRRDRRLGRSAEGEEDQSPPTAD
jgi:hypothetical protein